MTQIFLSIVNAAITAGYVVLAVLALRFLMKKAPKWMTCLLWVVVGLRLCLPISLESKLSLLPSAQTLPADLTTSANPQIYSGISAVDKVVNPALTEQIAQGAAPDRLLPALAAVWFGGLLAMAIYGAVTSLRIYRLTRPAICYRDNIYFCDDVESPFILGILRPRIYLPSGIDPAYIEPVIAHEQAHLKRKDHLWKPLGYILLAIYWFNPLLWVGYIFLCRDIELACDEKVIRNTEKDFQKRYSQALLQCSVGHRLVHVCPLAFGEVGMKDRIKAVLHYKKPALWILIGANILCIVLAVCFLTDPLGCDHAYEAAITRQPTCIEEGVETFTCQHCGHNYKKPIPMPEHTYDEGTVILNPTCTKKGVTEFLCTGCGAAKQEAIPMEDHIFGELSLEKAPNCTETGEKTGICQDCGQKSVVEVLPTNAEHAFQQTVTKAATCAEDGQVTNTCTRCGYSETVPLEKLRHDWKVGMELPATCHSQGDRQEICKNCSKEQWYKTPIDPDEHWWFYNPLGGYYECMYCSIRRED